MLRQHGTAVAGFAALVLVFAACEGNSLFAPEGSIASMSVQPAAVSIDALGAARQLSTVGRDSTGAAIGAVRVTWTSLNPNVASVDANGTVTALNVGKALIVASAACCATVDTAVVDVRQVVATVRMTPGSATIKPDSTIVVDAVPRDGRGNPIQDRPITWTSSAPDVAVVDAAGNVRALKAGSTTITATVDDKTGSSALVVANLASVAPPPSGVGGGPNEPSGFGQIFSYDGTAREVGGNFSPWWPADRARHVTDSEAPAGGAIELLWPEGTGTGGPVSTWKNWGTAYREIYLRAVVKWSPNWQRHPGGDKLTYFGLKFYKDQGSATQMFLALRGSGWPASMAVARQVATMQPAQEQWISAEVIHPGRYHEIEVWLKAESAAGASDGEIKMWIDGVLQNLRSTSYGPRGTHETHAGFVGAEATDTRFEGIQWQPYWGGSNEIKAHDDYMRWGTYYMSGR